MKILFDQCIGSRDVLIWHDNVSPPNSWDIYIYQQIFSKNFTLFLTKKSYNTIRKTWRKNVCTKKKKKKKKQVCDQMDGISECQLFCNKTLNSYYIKSTVSFTVQILSVWKNFFNGVHNNKTMTPKRYTNNK